MKTYISIGILSISSLILSSCYSEKFMQDDDVYVIKANEIQLGEDMTDEANYSNFKNRKNDASISSAYFSNDDLWYFHQNDIRREYINYLIYRYGASNSILFGNMYNYYPFPFHNPYFYDYSNFFTYYGNNYSAFYQANYGYYYNGYYNNGYYNNGYYNNNNYVNNNNSYTASSYNFHKGPRGSSSGFGNPNGRIESPGKVKSITYNGNTNGTSTNELASKRIDSKSFVGQNNTYNNRTNTANSNVSTYRNSSNSSTLRPTENRVNYSNSYSVNSGRTYNSNPSINSNNNRSTNIGNSGSFSGSRSNSMSSGGSSSGSRSGGSVSTGGGMRR